MKTKIEKVRRQLADLTALREADQATIATLALVNKELADALEAVLASACPNASEHLAMFDAWARGRTALRVAGRLPKGENDATQEP